MQIIREKVDRESRDIHEIKLALHRLEGSHRSVSETPITTPPPPPSPAMDSFSGPTSVLASPFLEQGSDRGDYCDCFFTFIVMHIILFQLICTRLVYHDYFALPCLPPLSVCYFQSSCDGQRTRFHINLKKTTSLLKCLFSFQ